VNSRDKRISVFARGNTGFLMLPSPSGAITTADRGHLLGLYRSAFFIAGGGGVSEGGTLTPVGVLLDTFSPVGVLIDEQSPVGILL
jgi:hypothetical protein